MRVALVGVCGSGKTVLARGLRRLGYEVRECAQEHSELPRMWQAISRPDVLIYLDASDEATRRRGQRHYVQGYAEIQRERLAHARASCDLCVNTDDLSEAEVLAKVCRFLAQYAP